MQPPMKTPALLSCLATLAAALAWQAPLRAANYYWDATPDASATLDYGSGTISTTDLNWWPTSGSSYVGWTNSLTDSMNIGGSGSLNGKTYTGGTTAAAFTLTLSGSISAQQFLVSGALNSGNPVTISDGGNSANTLTLANSGNIGNNSATSNLIVDAQILGGGANGIGKINGGTVILAKNNSYTGATTISGQTGAGNGGVLQIGNGGTAGSLGTGSVTFSLNGSQTAASTLRFNRSDALTVSNAMTILSANGVGGVVEQAGGNTLTLSGNVTLGTSGSAATSVLTYKIADTAQAVDTEVSGRITGIGGVAKTGAGTLVMSGSNTYTGATTVTAGTLLVNGFAGSTATTIGSGATVSGTGTLGSVTVQSGGILFAGSGLGILSSGAATLQSGAAFAAQLAGNTAMPVAGTNFSQLSVTGAISLDGTLSLTLDGNYVQNQGALYFLMLNDGADAISGTFSGLANGSTFAVGGSQFQISYFGDSATSSFTGGNDLVIMAVPEPSTVALACAASTLMALRLRRLARSSSLRCQQ